MPEGSKISNTVNLSINRGHNSASIPWPSPSHLLEAEYDSCEDGGRGPGGGVEVGVVGVEGLGGPLLARSQVPRDGQYHPPHARRQAEVVLWTDGVL